MIQRTPYVSYRAGFQPGTSESRVFTTVPWTFGDKGPVCTLSALGQVGKNCELTTSSLDKDPCRKTERTMLSL